MRRATPSPTRRLPPAPSARRTPRRWGRGPAGPALATAACAVGATLGLLACAATATGTGTKTAAEAPEPTRDRAGDEAVAAPETEPRAAEEGADATEDEATSTNDDDLIETVSASDDAAVVLAGGEQQGHDEPVTMVEAAAAARAQRAAAGPPVATITDENREERAARGRLTQVSSAGTGATPAPSIAEEETATTAEPTGETYWRSAARDARVRWRDATERVDELQARVAELRNAFYAADDPFYRDGVIKADWDAAVDDLAIARGEVATARADLRRVLDAGRRAGALPGWLREGLEVEPEPPREPGAEPATVEPVEPPMAEEGGRH